MAPVIHIIQIFSVLIQLTAVVLALRLIPITKAKQAWLSISGAILLMTLRRAISYMGMDYTNIGTSLLIFEGTGLITSILMVYGVAYIAPVFLELKRSEQALKEAHDHLEKRVEDRTAELAKVNEALQGEIAERKQVEAMLRLDEARFEALWQLSQMRDYSLDQISEFALEQQVRLTRSNIGWIGFMGEGEATVKTFTWSKSTVQNCRIDEKRFHLPDETAGIWADAIRERRAVIVNEYLAPDSPKRGYPEGHVPLERIMVIPVLEGERIAAIAAVANKEEEYNLSDARQLTLLMDGMWKLVQRERAEEALRESERLAAMGRAMSAVAHDMRTPLIAIGGFTHLALKHIAKDSPVHEKLEIVLKETQRLEDMVKDMLDFSRPLQLKRSAVDIGQLVAECITIVGSRAQDREVVISSQSEDDIPLVSLDTMRMKQVLINLLINAVEASPKGEEVMVHSHINGKNLLLEVIDCGCGIPTDKRLEIFSPFFTTKKEGTGLGLPIVKKIVEAHQGYVEVEDNPERGVTFRVEIPIK
jgi:signal transduction histidine kinase